MKKTLLFLFVFFFISRSYSQQQETVMIYVESGLYANSAVSEAINRMRMQLTVQGNIIVADINSSYDANTSIQTFRQDLLSSYQNNFFDGAILIGDLPIAWYENQNDHGQYGYTDFPTDLYFMDLLNSPSNWLDTAQNGAWGGQAKTGTFDGYSGTPYADIWISRIVPSVLTGISTNEATIVQDYCNHAVERILGNDNIATTGLAIGNTTVWPGFETEMFSSLGYPSTSITTFISPNDTRQNWVTALQNGVEYANVFEHASTTLQCFNGPYFYSSEYCTLNPTTNCRFYNLFDCSSSRYTTTDNLGGLYSTGHNGLISMGTTKTGSMLNFSAYNMPLSYQTTFGRGFKDWMNQYGVYNIDWHWGMSLQGCGALRMTKYPRYLQLPTGLNAYASSTSQINLSWTDNCSMEYGFYIERANASTGPWTVIGSAGSDVTTYSNTGLAANTTYWYRVQAFNRYGHSGYSNTVSAITQSALPAAPSNLVLTTNSRSMITLTWNDNASNESGFKIERAPSGGSFTQIATVGANVRTYANSGLATGTTYQYRVSAYNSSGTSAYSNTANTSTHANLSLAGTATAQSYQSGNVVANAKDNSTTTRWAASSSAMSQWWKIDLGASRTLSEIEIMFERTGTTGDCNDFKVETSQDNTNWTMRVDKQTNTNTAQTQAYTFSATARYVRLTINDAPGTYWASMYECRVFGK